MVLALSKGPEPKQKTCTKCFLKKYTFFFLKNPHVIHVKTVILGVKTVITSGPTYLVVADYVHACSSLILYCYLNKKCVWR